MRQKSNKKIDLHSFLKNEIDAISSLKNQYFVGALNRAADLLVKARGKIVITGIGKSGYIGMKLAATFTSLGLAANFLHPVEAFHGDLGIVTKEDVLLAISNSGETKEILRLVNYLRKRKIPLVVITGSKHSTLAKVANIVINYQIEKEGSPFNLAPMASVTVSLVVGDLLAAAASTKKGFKKEDFANFHPAGALGLQSTAVSTLMHRGRLVPTIEIGKSFSQALNEITKKGLGIVGVIDKRGKLAGAITDGDVRRFLLSPEFNIDVQVAKIMTCNPKTIIPEESLQEAMTKMKNYKVTSLFVVDRFFKPVGIIHMHRIVEEKIA